MKIIKKSIVLFAIILYSIKTFASLDQSEINVRESMITDRYYNEIIIYISDNKVKFTQDNDYYYFDITQELTNYQSYSSGYYKLNYQPTYIVSNLSSVNSLEIYIDDAIHTFDRRERILYGYSSVDDRVLVTEFRRDKSNNIRINSNSINFHIYNSSLFHNNQNVKNISFNMYGDSSVGKKFYLNAKFGIKKEYIYGLRYFSFLFNKIYSKLNSAYANTGETKCGATNYTIDLVNYINCEHDFELRSYDEEKHDIYCKKCEWEINDYHNFNIEYDKIENDECICGLRKAIRLTHKNNINKDVIEYLATPSTVYDKPNNELKGYTFLYYEDMELIDNDWNLATTSIITELPDYIPQNSHIYTAIYSANSYYIDYSSTNNLDLVFEEKMLRVKVKYGEKYVLDENMFKKTGYNFLGWAMRPNITTKIFNDKEEIMNLSDKDEDIITLYPVFSAYEFTIHYIDKSYRKDYYKKYSYHINQPLDINSEISYYDKFIGFVFNDILIKSFNTNELLQYIKKDNDTITLYAYYISDSKNNDMSKAEKITEEIKIISESYTSNEILTNDLPNIVEVSDNQHKKNNTKKNNFKYLDYDDGFIDIFLSTNLRYLNNNRNNNKLINVDDWRVKINKIIMFIKKILLSNNLYSNLIRFLIIFSCITISFLILLIIAYLIRKLYKKYKERIERDKKNDI